MKRYLHAAIACGAFPLIGSVLIYLLWWATGTPWGQLLMWGLLFVSVVSLPIGVIALMVYAGMPDEEGERTRGRLIAEVVLVTLLLLLGPVLCFVLARKIRTTDRTEAVQIFTVLTNREDLHCLRTRLRTHQSPRSCRSSS